VDHSGLIAPAARRGDVELEARMILIVVMAAAATALCVTLALKLVGDI
jgi:hypothetical protein